MRRIAVTLCAALTAAVLPSPASAATTLRALPVTAPSSAVNAAVSGSRVVWQELVDGEWDVRGVDLATNDAFVVAAGPGNQMRPDISGTRVVFQDDSSGNWDIKAYDVQTKVTTLVSFAPFDQIDPAIDGTRVVWVDHRSGNPDVFLRNLATGITVPVATHPAAQYDPDVSGSRVTWVDERFGNPDVFVKDVDNGCEVAVSVDSAAQRSPSISGTLVAWEDLRTGTSTIRSKFVVTEPGVDPVGEGTELAPGPAQRAPSVSSGRVAWTESAVTRIWDVAAETEHVVPAPADGVYVHSTRALGWSSQSGVWHTEVGAPVLRLVRPAPGAAYIQDVEVRPPYELAPLALVAGTQVTLEATASDAESGVDTVTFYVDGFRLCELTAPPYKCAWPVAAGPHRFSVEAADHAGNVSVRHVDAIAL